MTRPRLSRQQVLLSGRPRQLRHLARPWLLPGLALTLLVFGGALGYRITEGWDWGDCLWMVLITISTIGY